MEYGESLWRSAQFGMTPAQVAALFPDTRTGSRRRLNSGASNELSIFGYALGTDLFSVDFFFLNGGLREVVVRSEKVESQISQVNQASFEHLVAAETREHGRPRGSQTAQNISFFRGCQWQTKDLRVDIVFLEIDGQGIILNAYYRPRPTKT
jgi:hypothetical protein